MIDFRYHLVSLISVFLALAVGIALGAGPLKETIGDTLTGQVDQLRDEKDNLRTQLDAQKTETAAAEQYIAAAAPELLNGTLTGRNVAVVSPGTVDAETRTAVQDQLAEAGAKITAEVSLTQAWSSTDLRTFRQALSTSLGDYLDPEPDSGAGESTVLSEALVQALIGADPADPAKLDADASTLLQLLSTGDNPLIDVGDGVSAPADAVVLLTDDLTAPTTATTADEDEEQAALDAYTMLARVAAGRAEGSVVAGGAVADDELITQILSDDSVAGRVTTVNGVGTIAGQVSVPLALNADIGGTVGHYGSGDGLTVLPATTELPAPDRAAPSATNGGDTAGEGAQEATADAGAQG